MIKVLHFHANIDFYTIIIVLFDNICIYKKRTSLNYIILTISDSVVRKDRRERTVLYKIVRLKDVKWNRTKTICFLKLKFRNDTSYYKIFLSDESLLYGLNIAVKPYSINLPDVSTLNCIIWKCKSRISYCLQFIVI